MSEGRELSKELQNVLSSMGEYNELLEDLLSDACRALEELQVGMSKARQLFNVEHQAQVTHSLAPLCGIFNVG